ncbi:hypothetical protein PISMIDRAFT_330550 [Pisolithus microcarpus 441]|uniref:Uncharacterized protein n=1 Tax=Pisolithus microcarpus 441 TaxID=765257 RepID=A0A0C9Z5C1_9AGAM|nr:hypothetical protein PISMIDRAFT_330550 [Pisolithus microcarpus 441]
MHSIHPPMACSFYLTRHAVSTTSMDPSASTALQMYVHSKPNFLIFSHHSTHLPTYSCLHLHFPPCKFHTSTTLVVPYHLVTWILDTLLIASDSKLPT